MSAYEDFATEDLQRRVSDFRLKVPRDVTRDDLLEALRAHDHMLAEQDAEGLAQDIANGAWATERRGERTV